MSDDDNALNDLLFGPGYCNGCGLIKRLVMVAMPGMREDKETGELTGGTMHFDPLERSGYCEQCALKWLAKQKQ